jgi:CBS domain-containing protein
MLKVRDIMVTEVLTVTPDTPVRRLTRLLADHEISGAPVVNEEGRPVGVVSATDVVRLAADDTDIRFRAARASVDSTTPDPEGEEQEADPYGFFLPEDSPFAGERLLGQIPESEFDAATVADIMTPVSFTVEPDTEISDLADFLVRGRIHRAVVVEEGRLVGIITSGDVLRAVAGGQLN